MNDATPLKSGSLSSGAATVIGHSACPHDCPSTCALEVELLADNRIGRVRGDAANSYTAGVICAKVARYAERIHHPGRLLKPLIRAGAKGEGQWKEASFEAALDLIAENFDRAEAAHGSETVWLNHYAGTMGLVQRDGISPAAPRQALFQPVRQFLHQSLLDRLHHGHRRAARPRSARDGQVRLRGDLGHQRGLHPGQCHDPRHPRPKGARPPRSRSSTSTTPRR